MVDNISSRSFKFLKEHDEVKSIENDTLSGRNEFETKSTMEIQSSYFSQRRFSEKFPRLVLYIIISILALWAIISLILIITIKSRSISNSTVTSSCNMNQLQLNNSSIHFSRAIVLVTNDKEIKIMDPSNMQLFELHETNNEIAAFEVYSNETILWIEKNSTEIKSLSNILINTTFLNLVEPGSIGIDTINHKLYIIDQTTDIVYVIDLKSGYHSIIASDLKNPSDIVLDPVQGRLFIVQLHDSIFRINMDGTCSKEIINSDKVSRITINQMSRRIYWANDFQSLESSDYDGKNRIKLSSILTNVFSLTIIENKLFWICPSYRDDHTVIFSCSVHKDECNDRSLQEIPMKLKNIQSFQEHLTIPFNNPCSRENGECEQLCLLSNDGSHSCDCKIGWQLNEDMKTCSKMDYLMYAQGHYFRGLIIDYDRSRFKDAIAPVKFHTKILKNKDTIDFDIGWHDNEVIFCDDRFIFSLNLTDGKQIEILDVGKKHNIMDLTMNRMIGVIYFVMISKSGNDHMIVAIGHNENRYFQKIIKTSSIENFKNFMRKSLNSRRITLFTLQGIESENEIRWLELNGSSGRKYNTTAKGYPNGISTVDYSDFEGNTYWINNKNDYTLEIHSYTKKDDFTHSEIYLYVNENSLSICIYNAWIFLSDRREIWRFKKKGYSDPSKINFANPSTTDYKIHGIRIIPSVLLLNYTDNNCFSNNGGCEQFCFTMVKKYCDCDDKLQILEDGRCAS